MNFYLQYSQTSGTWSTVDDDHIATPIARGWSGNHAGKNNPAMQNVPCIGPLPQGWYTRQMWEATHDHLGPMVAFLLPDGDNAMFGRGDFFIHGTARDPESYGQESKGCTVLPRADRQAVKDTGLTRVKVVI